MLNKFVERFKPYKLIYWKAIGGYVREDSEQLKDKKYYIYFDVNGNVVERKVRSKELYYKILKSGGLARLDK